MIIDKAKALSSLYPTEDWILDGDDLKWLDENTPKPTEAEIDAEIVKLEAEYDAQEYARNRKAEYDALNQFELITDDAINGTTTHIDAIKAIKKKYPK